MPQEEQLKIISNIIELIEINKKKLFGFNLKKSYKTTDSNGIKLLNINDYARLVELSVKLYKEIKENNNKQYTQTQLENDLKEASEKATVESVEKTVVKKADDEVILGHKRGERYESREQKLAVMRERSKRYYDEHYRGNKEAIRRKSERRKELRNARKAQDKNELKIQKRREYQRAYYARKKREQEELNNGKVTQAILERRAYQRALYARNKRMREAMKNEKATNKKY